MNKIKILIIGLLALLLTNNVNAQNIPALTRIDIHAVPIEKGVNLNTAHMKIEIIDAYLPAIMWQEQQYPFNQTYIDLPGNLTYFDTDNWLGGGHVYVQIRGKNAYGNGVATIVSDNYDGYVYDRFVSVHIDVTNPEADPNLHD